jgi:hypothetical protein
MEWLTESSAFAEDDSQGFTFLSNILSSCEWIEIPRPAGLQTKRPKKQNRPWRRAPGPVLVIGPPLG